MKVAILDDRFDTLRTLTCFDKLAGHEVTVFTDHVQGTDVLAERLADFDTLVLILGVDPRGAAPRSAAGRLPAGREPAGRRRSLTPRQDARGRARSRRCRCISGSSPCSSRSRSATRRTCCSRWTTSSARPTSATTREEWELQFADIFDQINAFAAGAPINVVSADV